MKNLTNTYEWCTTSKTTKNNKVSTQANLILEWFSFNIWKEIDIDKAQEIHELIIEENLINWPHMLEKTTDEIISQVQELWCSSISKSWILVWFSNIMSVKHNSMILYEMWSFIVKKEYRNKGIWKVITKNLLKSNMDKPVYAVSNSKPAIKVLEWFEEFVEISKNQISVNILEIIESAWALLNNDKVFINKTLLKIIENINNQKLTWK